MLAIASGTVVERRYRLQADDLIAGPVVVTITNVTVEGLETLRPVIHFDKLDKPLVLDPGSANDLAHLTRSAVMEEWIGHSVQLAPVEGPDGLALAFLLPAAPTPTVARLTRPAQEQRSRRSQAWLMALVLGLIFLAVYLLENTSLFAAITESLFGGG